ncbi:MAG: MCE family protein [Alphaproteobacteria bacterium]|nr:MCE family protein [Alphaproteobacteria bacterium]
MNNLKEFFKKAVSRIRMMIRREQPFETLLGVFVLFLSVFFLFWAMSKADLKRIDGYTLYASFSKITSLSEGTNVALHGVKVGSIEEISLDSHDYTVKIKMTIDPHVKLPRDTIAEIATDGLIGDRYLRLKLGEAPEFLQEGETMGSTDFLSLEDMIGQVLFSSGSEEKSDEAE